MFATETQIAALTAAAQAHGRTAYQVATEYMGDPAISLSRIPADIISDMIARAGVVHDSAAPAYTADQIAKFSARNADAEQARRDAALKEAARLQAASADTARIDAILTERGHDLDAMSGSDRREARRLLRRELEA